MRSDFNLRVRFAVLAAILVTALVTALGCGPDDTTSGSKSGERRDGPVRIVATTGMVGDLARRVGGEHVTVDVLMGAGVDPHLYKASPGDITKLTSADLVLYSGHHLEGKMADVLVQVGRKRPVLAVTERIPEDQLLSDVVNTEFPDPHLWFDVALWSKGLDPVAEILSEVDPANAEAYRANAEGYRKELLELDAEIRAQVATIPKPRRLLITAHDAFRYYGRAYGIEVRGIQGISTESEAGLSEINRLVDLIATRKVTAVFVETSVSAKNVQALIEGAQQRGLKVRIGGNLFSDAMGAPGTPEGTYQGMVRHNTKQIVQALR
ncbi:MAG: zinc ABC transporter substrate-binding protein [Fimbriimonadaceae bacterium]|nr:zinc ABC transporter substrate-binding protein [Fimbriimonadaceae bacterium]